MIKLLGINLQIWRKSNIAIVLQFIRPNGSEFDVVIMCIPKTAPMLLTRNLLYTGITRARKLLIVIGDGKTVGFMIGNVDSKRRNTGLKYKLERNEI